MAEKRTRNWETIVYPESAPENFIDILADQKVNFFVSPLHDRDVTPQGEPKKPHYHVLVMFDSVKDRAQAEEVFSYVNGVGCVRVNSLRGSTRYLAHMDDPDKAQYDPNDVIVHGSVDFFGIISLPTDKYDAIADMIDYVDRERIISYAQLLRHAKANNETWFRVLCDSGTLVMKEFIKSRTWEVQNGEYE